jgi:CheY-like chemotaxis protein
MTQILVVDDVPAMAEQYAYDLKRVGGYGTIVASGGDEALDILGRDPIDCVVLDLEMPGIDGFDVLRRLQQRGIDTPVIVYTGAGNLRALRPGRSTRRVRLRRQGEADRARRQEIENAVSRGRLVKELHTLDRGSMARPHSSATAHRCAHFVRRSRGSRRFRAASSSSGESGTARSSSRASCTA